jgi:hypothetical protein
MDEQKYYFDNVNPDIFSTVWYGFFLYEENDIQIPISENYYQQSNRELDDLLSEICEINFYVTLNNNYIYLSIDSDTKYYYYYFEKNLKDIILKIEEKFNIHIQNGEFNAIEYRPNGNQYIYTISRSNDENKRIILKKKILNWGVLELKKKRKAFDVDNIGFDKMKI